MAKPLSPGDVLRLLAAVEVRARRSSSASSTSSAEFAARAARALRWKRDGGGGGGTSDELAGLLGGVSAYLLDRLIASEADASDAVALQSQNSALAVELSAARAKTAALQRLLTDVRAAARGQGADATGPVALRSAAAGASAPTTKPTHALADLTRQNEHLRRTLDVLHCRLGGDEPPQERTALRRKDSGTDIRGSAVADGCSDAAAATATSAARPRPQRSGAALAADVGSEEEDEGLVVVDNARLTFPARSAEKEKRSSAGEGHLKRRSSIEECVSELIDSEGGRVDAPRAAAARLNFDLGLLPTPPGTPPRAGGAPGVGAPGAGTPGRARKRRASVRRLLKAVAHSSVRLSIETQQRHDVLYDLAIENLAHSVEEMLDTRDDAVLLLPFAITPRGQTRGESDATHVKATAKAVAHERGKSVEIATVAQQLAVSFFYLPLHFTRILLTV